MLDDPLLKSIIKDQFPSTFFSILCPPPIRSDDGQLSAIRCHRRGLRSGQDGAARYYHDNEPYNGANPFSDWPAGFEPKDPIGRLAPPTTGFSLTPWVASACEGSIHYNRCSLDLSPAAGASFRAALSHQRIKVIKCNNFISKRATTIFYCLVSVSMLLELD